MSVHTVQEALILLDPSKGQIYGARWQGLQTFHYFVKYIL